MKQLYRIGVWLAIALLVCLLPMPYGYYTLVRLAATIFFACLAVAYSEKRDTHAAFIAGGVALLFQPFAKLPLGRELWNLIDIIVAFVLVLMWYKYNKKR